MKRTTGIRQRQTGVSTAGWLLIATIFGLLVISFFKVFPMYYDNFKVKTVLEAIAQDQAVDPKSKRSIWDAVQKRLYINEVRYITRENVSMDRKDGKTTVTISYETRDNYIGNLFIGGSFNESIVIDR